MREYFGVVERKRKRKLKLLHSSRVYIGVIVRKRICFIGIVQGFYSLIPDYPTVRKRNTYP